MTFATTASMTIGEMREFAGFTPCEQRFIKRSLDVGLERCDALAKWGLSPFNRSQIKRQQSVYRPLPTLRALIPLDDTLEGIEPFIGKLVTIAAYDLAQEDIASFSAFRFLYERLIGPEARPFLPSIFCGAAALPAIAPEHRKTLLQSLSEAAATAPGWSHEPPHFFPELVEAAEAA